MHDIKQAKREKGKLVIEYLNSSRNLKDSEESRVVEVGSELTELKTERLKTEADPSVELP